MIFIDGNSLSELRNKMHLSTDYLSNYLNISKNEYAEYEISGVSSEDILSKLSTLYEINWQDFEKKSKVLKELQKKFSKKDAESILSLKLMQQQMSKRKTQEA